MTALLIDPHGDDAALFAAYICQRENPIVLVTHQTVPRQEVAAAMRTLGVSWKLSIGNGEPDRVYAPAFHPEGHAEHNEAAEMALTYGVPVVSYCTYAPRGQRTRTDNEVPYEALMVARKLRALSCFVSQIEQESTRPWFTYLLDVREWLA